MKAKIDPGNYNGLWGHVHSLNPPPRGMATRLLSHTHPEEPGASWRQLEPADVLPSPQHQVKPFVHIQIASYPDSAPMEKLPCTPQHKMPSP